MVIIKALLLIFLIGGTYIQAATLYDTCKDKANTCFGMGASDDCVQKGSCKLLAAIVKVKTGYKFNLHSKPVDTDTTYMAVGLSTDGIAMKDVAVVSCQKSSTAGGGVQPYWATTKKSSAITMVPPADLVVAGSEKFLLDNNEMSCEFTLKPSFTISNNAFDLDTKKYKILLAVGEYDDLATNLKIKYHTARKLSTEMFNLNHASGASASTSNTATALRAKCSSALFLMTIVTWTLFYLH